MTTKMHRPIVNAPGRMQSHSAHGLRMHLPRSKEVLDAEAREGGIGDPMHLDDVEAVEQSDEQMFRLQLAFKRTYGAPGGEFTVVVGPSALGGNGVHRRGSFS